VEATVEASFDATLKLVTLVDVLTGLLRKFWGIEIKPCYFAGMAILIMCHFKKRNKLDGNWSVLHQAG
jgi:hypothetical protein